MLNARSEHILSIETGELAKQAAGSCLVQYGETVVLCGHRLGPGRGRDDFFPLTCDYRERVAAAGKFPGGFLKREGRPTTKEILTARLMDRPIRPLVSRMVSATRSGSGFVLATDRQNDGDVLAMNGASAALTISPLPFQGPIASVRLGYIEGEFVPFPTHDALEESDLDLIVSGSKESILMIEGFAREMPEDLHGRRHRDGPRLYPPDVRNAGGVGREGRHGQEAVRGPAARSPVGHAAGEILRRLAPGQADRRQAGPGRGVRGASRTRPSAE